jgi:muramoyltetrapeptide carboxypeptidase
MIKNISLKPGDTVGFIAPSSPLRQERIETGIRYFESKGLKVKLGKNLRNTERFLAGTDEERAADVMRLFADPDVKAIIATAGGVGSQRLLPLLNYDVIADNPKILAGFSDTTALQLGLFQKIGLISYSGFTLRDTDPGKPDPLVDRTLMACLMSQPYSVSEGRAVNSGCVEGVLIGGTLSLISTLMGTPFQPNFKNKILFFEQVDTEPSLVDGLLTQLYQAGIFDQVRGVIIGQFEQCIPHEPDRDGTIDDVINEWCERIKVPCLKDFPYGHGDRRCVLPIGKSITLDVNARCVTID